MEATLRSTELQALEIPALTSDLWVCQSLLRNTSTFWFSWGQRASGHLELFYRL